ncbi:hypothetical protein M413DRAFT_71028 [Hebeloma cylindrosporum]|uniref:Fe2OG dioxygenase domain-containing protein n=1 Tax=Hebeloma cylindrosporum TaxID=76867 RepID=A0A0C3CDZ1_HEBCY|nr:hypothetical protein M413DRAFT_71028 [Hebeloma cylindrosporum h7]
MENQRLSTHHLPGHDDVYYIPNFITEEEEKYLIRKINDSPQPMWKKLVNRRLQIWGGELTTKGILVAHPFPPFIDQYPDIIGRIKATGAFDQSPHKAPNHVIMNEYLPGQGIMPHEDGPRYHPVVATLSLGSHAIFHYYQYQSEDNEIQPAVPGNGKTINMNPVLSVLLEPRSLIISSGAMYLSHLHGQVIVSFLYSSSLTYLFQHPGHCVMISNLDQLQDAQIKRAIREGQPLKRGVRYSLTCRDVGRVSSLNTRR